MSIPPMSSILYPSAVSSDNVQAVSPVNLLSVALEGTLWPALDYSSAVAAEPPSPFDDLDILELFEQDNEIHLRVSVLPSDRKSVV